MRFWIALIMGTIFVFAGPAEARKVALIIGNSQYQNTSPLENPANDAQIVSVAARKAGFDVVTVAKDLTAQKFQLALRDFRARANGAEVAMVYYAGHGIEGQGKNWLIPVDAELSSSFDLPYEAINLDRVMESLSGAQIRMIILDACRNNPFGRSWKSGTRAVTRGLVGIEADDVLVIYAAAPGQTASDGSGGNSPFAKSLAKRLPQPDLPVQLLGGSVRDDVLSATGGEQRPFVSASITGTPVYLVRNAPNPAPVVTAPSGPTAPSVSRSTLESIMWNGALASNSISAYSAYLSEFPRGKHAGEASQKISALLNPVKQPVSANSVPQPKPISSNAVSQASDKKPNSGQVTGLSAKENAPPATSPQIKEPVETAMAIPKELPSKKTGTEAKRGNKTNAGLMNAGYPFLADVAATEALPIDGNYTLSTNKKSVRIEGGRGFALEGWNHNVILKIQPDMVLWQNIEKTGDKTYEADDLRSRRRIVMTVEDDGTLAIKYARRSLFEKRYKLLKSAEQAQ